MKITIILFVIIIPLILSGCVFNQDGKIYSVEKFLAVKDQFVNRPVKLKGFILYKNECSGEPCPKYFIFNDDMNGSVENRLLINFPTETKEDYNSLPIAKKITLSAQYYPKGQVENVLANDNGYFVFNYFLNPNSSP